MQSCKLPCPASDREMLCICEGRGEIDNGENEAEIQEGRKAG